MRLKTILALGALATCSAAAAQAGPVAQQSSEQLICRLTGDCAKVDDSLATADRPENRGFNIMRSSAKPASTTTPARASTVPQRETARVATNRNAATSARNRSQLAASAAAAPAAIGRGDLMITFVTGSALLTEQAKVNAREFTKALKDPRLAGKHFRIEGHTDAVGGREYNLDLSQRRAQAVVDFLAGNGADRSLFEVKGYGFDKPLEGTTAMAPANRRVEVVRTN